MKSRRFIDDDTVELLINDRDDVVYLIASGIEQRTDFDEGSRPVEVGPRRIVGLRLRTAHVLDLADTLHTAVCAHCSAVGRAVKRRRVRAVHAMAIDICRKYAKEHPEYAEAAGQIAVRITQAALKAARGT